MPRSVRLRVVPSPSSRLIERDSSRGEAVLHEFSHFISRCILEHRPRISLEQGLRLSWAELIVCRMAYISRMVSGGRLNHNVENFSLGLRANFHVPYHGRLSNGIPGANIILMRSRR